MDLTMNNAARNGFPNVVKALLSHGADASFVYEDGMRPLKDLVEEGWKASAAMRPQYTRIIQLFLQSGLDINAQGPHSIPCLFYAAFIRYAEVVGLMLKHGADINAETVGMPPVLSFAIHEACIAPDESREDYEKTIELLIDARADVNGFFAGGDSYLCRASTYGNLGLTELLLKHGADANAIDNFGETCLYRASVHGHAGVAELLLRHGARVDTVDECGRTSLLWASFCGHADVVMVLLNYDADPQSVDKEGRSSEWRASQRGFQDVVRLLQNKVSRKSRARSLTHEDEKSMTAKKRKINEESMDGEHAK